MANGWTPGTASATGRANQELETVERSTGPRTPEGKLRTSRNADKGDTRGMLRAISRLLRGQSVE